MDWKTVGQTSICGRVEKEAEVEDQREEGRKARGRGRGLGREGTNESDDVVEEVSLTNRHSERVGVGDVRDVDVEVICIDSTKAHVPVRGEISSPRPKGRKWCHRRTIAGQVVHEEPQLSPFDLGISSHDLSLADGADRSEKGEVRSVECSEGGDVGRVRDTGDVEVGESPIASRNSERQGK
jgi:hypothetical protein